MALPQPTEARLYYRGAKQRYDDDAELFLEAGRTTGAVYLAGYTVECILKALILASVASRRRRILLRLLVGSRAHDIEWPGALYRQHARGTVPISITRHLARVAAWSTDLRYATGILKRQDADDFMRSLVAITSWAEARM
jgi:hypothetical protein